MNPTSHEKDPVLGRAIGKIPSGVYVLTARAPDGDATAMLASWVQQASFAPLSLSVAMAKDRPAYDIVRRAGAFVLSVLGEHDAPLMKRYARGIKSGEDPFAGVNVNTTPTAQPYLADALAWIECKLTHALEFGADHDILIGRVIAGHTLREGHPFTHVRGSGYHY
jgi:3-hydroxy-9,10-secoandrosta-1,3,5(10)-triene-9,17-dione monooxygenase reductase component